MFGDLSSLYSVCICRSLFSALLRSLLVGGTANQVKTVCILLYKDLSITLCCQIGVVFAGKPS